MQEKALASKWEGRRVKSIHNPIPDFFFEQQDRNACKRALGLSDDKTIILCIAGNLSEERKGGPILKQILQSSQMENVQFLLVGEKVNNFVDSPKVRQLGFISDDITLRIIYNAADILLHPAPIDNLPNTVAESMSCGTPVLAFTTGGLPEMVKPEKSGWLVDTIDAKSMIAKIVKILNSRSCACIRKSTKTHAKSLFDSASVGKKLSRAFPYNGGEQLNEFQQKIGIADENWLMSAREKLGLIGLLNCINPKTVIEFGYHRGGATKWLSKFANKVITVDVNEFVSEASINHPNVEPWNCTTNEAIANKDQH